MIALTDWRVFLLVLLAFAIVFAWKRIVSLASVVCAALYPVFTFLFLFLAEFSGSPLPSHGEHSLAYVLFATLAAVFIGGTVLVKHRANIGRLRRGEEKPVIFGKRSKAPASGFHAVPAGEAALCKGGFLAGESRKKGRGAFPPFTERRAGFPAFSGDLFLLKRRCGKRTDVSFFENLCRRSGGPAA